MGSPCSQEHAQSFATSQATCPGRFLTIKNSVARQAQSRADLFRVPSRFRQWHFLSCPRSHVTWPQAGQSFETCCGHFPGAVQPCATVSWCLFITPLKVHARTPLVSSSRSTGIDIDCPSPRSRNELHRRPPLDSLARRRARLLDVCLCFRRTWRGRLLHGRNDTPAR